MDAILESGWNRKVLQEYGAFTDAPARIYGQEAGPAGSCVDASER